MWLIDSYKDWYNSDKKLRKFWHNCFKFVTSCRVCTYWWLGSRVFLRFGLTFANWHLYFLLDGTWRRESEEPGIRREVPLLYLQKNKTFLRDSTKYVFALNTFCPLYKKSSDLPIYYIEMFLKGALPEKFRTCTPWVSYEALGTKIEK